MGKFEKLMLPGTVLLIIVFAWFFVSGTNAPGNQSSQIATTETSDTPNKRYDAKRGEMGAVMLEITPLDARTYEISLNTHSVELDFDLAKIISLEDNLGNAYEADSWSGESGGHHLTGLLIFPPISSEARSVKMVVRGIENEVLDFEWTL